MTIIALEALTFGLGRMAEAAAVAGERLCLLTRDRRIYDYELGRASTDAVQVIDVDTYDRRAVLKELAGIDDLNGLISSTDTWSQLGAELAAELALPGLDPAIITLVRNKTRVRNTLYERGLSRGRAIELDPWAGDATWVLTETGLPAVVKDTAGTGSQNVWLVRDAAEFDAALREAASRRLYGRLLAEPFFSGPVYSAETLTWQGRTRLLGVSSRLMSPEPLFREEITAFPVLFPEAERIGLENRLDEVLAALGYTDRFAHVEFALTRDGLEIIEVNPRIGGALVAEGMCRSLGYNVYLAMVELALGRRPELIDAELPGGPAVAFVLGYPREPGTFVGVAGLDRLESMPGSPAWYPTKVIGTHIEQLSDSRGYAGILYAEAATAELATHRAVAAANAVRVLTESPAVGAAGG